MGVRKRQLKGKETAEYHYEFMQNGKRYYGEVHPKSWTQLLRCTFLWRKNKRNRVSIV